MVINISLTFEKNRNDTEGGYFIISGETGEKSTEPFYWPELVKNNDKSEKLTNMEIILESNNSVGISSFALMRRRAKEEDSYLGDKCNIKTREGILSGKCGDGFYCNSKFNGSKCEKIPKKECKSYDTNDKCTQCYLISKAGIWNNKGINLNCDLDYIDITKVKINNLKKIEVAPAIHWRVTMDFWIWISDTSILNEAKVNLNIIYKDFMSLTLRCYSEGLTIYATPIEWLYEYPKYDLRRYYIQKSH